MANQQNSYTGSQGSGANNAFFDFTFPSYTTSEVKVEVDNVVKTLTTHYTVENYNTSSGGKVKFTTNNIPTGTTPVRIFRQTDVETPKATFTAGASLKAAEINDNFKQLRHALQESIGAVATDRKVQRFNIEADSIDGTLIADDVIDSEHYVAGSIDLEHMSANSVDSDQYVDGSIDLIHMSANSVDSDQYVDGSIDRVHLEADIIDGSKIEDNAVDNEHITANAVRTSEIQNSAVTQDKLANNSVGTPELINGSVNSDKIANGTIVNADISSSAAIDASKIVSASGSVAGTMSASDKTKLDGIESGATADQTASEIKTLLQSDKLTASEIATGTLDGRYFTETELTNGALDGRYFTETEADARYFNISTGDTIKDGDTFPDNDTTIATTAAINDRIIDLVDDVGGFVPIANETSFPTTNPDVNNGTGTIVSVSAASTNLAPSGTTVTIANGAGTGNTVTITGVSATIPSGFGFLVETTTTLHTYTFHRLSPKATEVTTVAGKATEIGRLGTAAAVADMAILGTADVVADLNTLGTADVVSDMNTLAVSDVISDMNTLAVTSVVNNMDTVATNVANVNLTGGSITNVNTTAGSISNVNTVAAAIANVNTTAGSISNVNTTAGSISNVNSVASNMANVNNFADRYQIASSNPSTDGGGNALAAGDLYFNTSANELKVYNGSAWQGGVTATGNFASVTGNTFTGNNNHNDNVKSIYGASNDLQVYHDGTNSYLMNNTGTLRIRGNDIRLQNINGETYTKHLSDGAVFLAYDNATKFETTSTGVNITGVTVDDGATHDGDVTFIGNSSGTDMIWDKSHDNLKFNDSVYARFGTGSDLQIFHNGTDSYIDNNTGDFYIQTTGSGDDILLESADDIVLKVNGSNNGIYVAGGAQTELYWNANKRLQTNSLGVDIFGGTNYGNLWIYTDDGNKRGGLYGGINELIGIVDDQNHFLAFGTKDGHFTLRYDQSTKLETTSSGVQVTGNLALGTDTGKIYAGATNDLQLYHDGTNSYLQNVTGVLYINNTGGTATNLIVKAQSDIELQPAAGETGVKAIANGAVELYYDNQKALKTTDNGILVYGHDGDAGHLYLYADDGDQLADRWVLRADASSSQLKIRNIASGSWEESLVANGNGSTNLYYDNSLKLATTSYGSQVSGDLAVGANKDMYYDRGIHLSANGTGAVLHLTDNTSGHTKNDGFDVLAHGGNAYLFLREAGIMYFGTDSGNKWEILSNGTYQPSQDSSYDIGQNGRRVRNGYFDTLYGDGSNLTGISSVGGSTGVDFNDSVKARFGTGNDLEIYHDGSNSYIDNHTGVLNIRGGTGTTIKLQPVDGEDGVLVGHNSTTELYYDNVKRFATTTSGGIFYNSSGTASVRLHGYGSSSGAARFSDILMNQNMTLRTVYNDHIYFNTNQTNRAYFDGSSGHFLPTSNNTYNLGSSSLRWSNVYTNDLHLSNEGHTNDVDGSWGDWTIQEGESDLFLKNNRSGKKYKFNLTEIS